VVLATGTFLRGKIFIGDSSFESGPNGLAPSVELADNLKKHGHEAPQVQNRNAGAERLRQVLITPK
jgi:tRNA U34 5-carboxymethylaminomethyl modifying enzyme MnmG/GidA